MSLSIRIGTRGSQLALTQARWVQSQIAAQHPNTRCELVIIKTSGDRFVDQPLSTLGGKGLFVKEIEEAMLAGSIDCAVHSMKDVPNELAAGLVIAAVPPREDVRDVLIRPYQTVGKVERNSVTPAKAGVQGPLESNRAGSSALDPGFRRDDGQPEAQSEGNPTVSAAGARLASLPSQARVGTSSLRRAALLRALRPDLRIEPLRGNVDSRLRKLDAGNLDAIVLAAAGLRRLSIEREHAQLLDTEEILPAVGQGALAIESRPDEIQSLLAVLDHAPTRLAVTAERAFLQTVGGSCRTPLAAYAELSDGTLWLRALIASLDGSQILRGERRGPATQASELGISLGQELLARGGDEILRALEGADGG